MREMDEEEKEKRSERQTKDGMLSRYGKFNLKKSVVSLIVDIIIVFLVFFIKREITFEVFILIGLLCGHEIAVKIITYSELYKIKNRVVSIRKIFCKKEVALPEELILIVSKGSRNSSKQRISTMKHPHFVKLDCLMICIVSNCTVREVLNMMRWNAWSKDMRYFNVIIREIFMDNIYNDFLFSFAYNKTELQKLIENHKVEIIIPRSLMADIDLSFVSVPIHIDEEN